MREIVHADNSIWVEIAVFVLGGGAYGLMEILFRGHTHWTMLVTGGACALTLFYLREWLLAQPLAVSALAGAIIITVYELAVGLLVNVKFGWHVWDVYRDLVRGLLFVPVGGAAADACGLSTGYGKRAGCHEA